MRRRARELARDFLRAFIDYERGRRTRPTRAGIDVTTTTGLALALRANPPRRPPVRRWPRPAQIRRLWVVGPSAGRLKVLAELARPGRRHRDVLELRLHREAGRWRVAELG